MQHDIADARQDDPPPLWDDVEFKARVIYYSRREGRQAREVCQAAGVSADYLYKPPGRGGRSVEAILRIAHELGVEPGVLITPSIPKDQRKPPSRDATLARLAFVLEVAVGLYAEVSKRRVIPDPEDGHRVVSSLQRLTDETDADQIVRILMRIVKRAELGE